MTLAEYIADIPRRNQLAAALGTSSAYVWQIGTGRRRASIDLALRIEAATGGVVDKATLRPDAWGLISDSKEAA